jgi:hypothetical protein
VDQDQEFWFGHTQREKREERENVEEIREEREGENLVCVTKPKFLVLVHTRFSQLETRRIKKKPRYKT